MRDDLMGLNAYAMGLMAAEARAKFASEVDKNVVQRIKFHAGEGREDLVLMSGFHPSEALVNELKLRGFRLKKDSADNLHISWSHDLSEEPG